MLKVFPHSSRPNLWPGLRRLLRVLCPWWCFWEVSVLIIILKPRLTHQLGFRADNCNVLVNSAQRWPYSLLPVAVSGCVGGAWEQAGATHSSVPVPVAAPQELPLAGLQRGLWGVYYTDLWPVPSRAKVHGLKTQLILFIPWTKLCLVRMQVFLYFVVCRSSSNHS